MKRLCSTIAVLGLLLSAPAALANAEGDYNGDGAVDEADKDIIFAAQNTREGDNGFVAACDHDGDGVISLSDVSHFSQIYLNQ